MLKFPLLVSKIFYVIKDSFTRNVVTSTSLFLWVTPFDLFDGHFDRLTGWAVSQSVHDHWHNAKLYGDFDGHGDSDGTCKQTFSQQFHKLTTFMHKVPNRFETKVMQ